MTTAPRPRISGFCNRTLPRTATYDPHQRCPGCDCRAPGCPCAPTEDPTVTTDVPEHWPVQPTSDGTHTCGGCGRSWNDDVSTSITPSPSGRCPFEAFHANVEETQELDTPEPEPVPADDAVAAVRAAVDALNIAMRDYNPEDWVEALLLLRELRRTTAITGQLDASLVTWLYLHGEHGLHQQLPGIAGEVHIGRGRKRERWASQEAVRAYVAAKIEEIGGEFPDPATVVDWVLEVLPATASTSLRKTPIRAANLDLDEFYESLPGSPQVSVLI